MDPDLLPATGQDCNYRARYAMCHCDMEARKVPLPVEPEHKGLPQQVQEIASILGWWMLYAKLCHFSLA
jgi:hypothetical protein